MIDIYELVKKLVGEIEPVGETHIDDKRFENLKKIIELMDNLLTEIDDIYFQNKDKQEYSIKRAVKYIDDFFNRLGIKED